MIFQGWSIRYKIRCNESSRKIIKKSIKIASIYLTDSINRKIDQPYVRPRTKTLCPHELQFELKRSSALITRSGPAFSFCSPILNLPSEDKDLQTDSFAVNNHKKVLWNMAYTVKSTWLSTSQRVQRFGQTYQRQFSQASDHNKDNGRLQYSDNAAHRKSFEQEND